MAVDHDRHRPQRYEVNAVVSGPSCRASPLPPVLRRFDADCGHGLARGRLAGIASPHRTLDWEPALDRLDLLAEPVAASLRSLDSGVDAHVAAIDPDLADTATFCAAYGRSLAESANCVVLAAKRSGETVMAACVVLATTRADVNGLARRTLGARKASFAAMDLAVEATGMEHGGITPVGLPPGWPILVDAAVAAARPVVVGSGLRRSKLLVPGGLLAELPDATVLDGLGVPPPT